MARILPLLVVALGLSAVVTLVVFATRLDSWPANLRASELRRTIGGAVREAVTEAIEAAEDGAA